MLISSQFLFCLAVCGGRHIFDGSRRVGMVEEEFAIQEEHTFQDPSACP